MLVTLMDPCETELCWMIKLQYSYKGQGNSKPNKVDRISKYQISNLSPLGLSLLGSLNGIQILLSQNWIDRRTITWFWSSY